MAGIQASAGLSIYNATKFGVIGFSKSMALELGLKGIRVNVIAPGPIETPTNMAVLQGRDAIQEAEGMTALGRMGKPEEVADAVCYLLSDKSSFVNGTVLEISGGI
jgi:NAD(P)-dependent dehydrogenase (short-subunit alcohol dehydrogenase family)